MGMSCLLAAIICLTPFESNDQSKVDTLVICPIPFQQALKNWLDYRTQQGHGILVQAPASTAVALRKQIQSVASTHSIKHIVLVGDAADRKVDPSMLVPTDYVRAKVNVKFGSEPEIATDHTYADLDNDSMVDVSIGRIPVDSAAELKQFTRRIMEYENDDSVGKWQRQINFVAGVGGFGSMLDKMIEQSVKKIITDLIPPEFETTMTYGSWRSPYCPDPRRFFVDRN